MFRDRAPNGIRSAELMSFQASVRKPNPRVGARIPPSKRVTFQIKGVSHRHATTRHHDVTYSEKVAEHVRVGAVRQNDRYSCNQCENQCEQNRCAKDRYLPAIDANSVANGFHHRQREGGIGGRYLIDLSSIRELERESGVHVQHDEHSVVPRVNQRPVVLVGRGGRGRVELPVGGDEHDIADEQRIETSRNASQLRNASSLP